MNRFTQYFNNLSLIFSHKHAKSKDLSKKTSSYNPTIQKDITAIIDKYIKKEKAYNNNNLESLQFDMLVLEKDLQERYNKNKSNNFSFPEIKNVLDCIADVLTYFKDIPNFKSDNRMRWQIEQTINLIKNASQETVCADIKFDKCPPEDTISTIKNVNNKGFFNIKNENVIFRHGKEYCSDNLYETPYNSNQYPYAYSIRVMVQAISLVDLINIELKNKKQGDVWKSHYATVYFGERYHYYLDYLLDNAPDVFILPILQNVGATTLIRNRYSRIQPCGIIFDEAFVDEDMQTPSNFFWHDLNHARRIYQNNLWYSKQNNMDLNTLYTIMRKDVQELMPIKKWLSSNPENMKYESLIKILLFEVVHEDALPFTKDSIKMDILFSSGNCYPYERTYDNVEEGNPYNRINLRFYEQGASTLRTIYNKVRHAFFEKEQTNDIIVKTELRYIKHMVEASYLLLNKVSPNEYNENNKEAICEQLKQLIRDRTFQAHNAKRLLGVNTDSQDRSSHSGSRSSSRRRNKV
jgi:septum formation topological specificity factor MinE